MAAIRAAGRPGPFGFSLNVVPAGSRVHYQQHVNPVVRTPSQGPVTCSQRYMKCMEPRDMLRALRARQSALDAFKELRAFAPGREWRLIEVDASLADVDAHMAHILGNGALSVSTLCCGDTDQWDWSCSSGCTCVYGIHYIFFATLTS